jgi:hypothetical protein
MDMILKQGGVAMTRSVARVRKYGKTWSLATEAPLGACVFIFETHSRNFGVCVAIANRYEGPAANTYNYVVDQNCSELVASEAPISIIIDAILEVPYEQWRSNYGPVAITQAIEFLEAIACMNIVTTAT